MRPQVQLAQARARAAAHRPRASRLAGRAWLALAALAWLGAGCRAPPLEQQAYLWQRAWTPAVSSAAREHGGRFARLLVLGAQLGWQGRAPRAVRPALDASALAGRPVGLVLRVELPPAPMPVGAVVAEAEALLARARAAGLDVAELQLDLDCPTSRLGEYADLLRAARAALAPVPLTFTALPAWLGSPELPALVASADGFVLQVHSLESREGAWASLCDPAQALRWAKQADRLGVPFRLALPTYGYLVALDASGRALGVVAEQAASLPPGAARTRVVRADAPALADLLENLQRARLAHLGAVVWFRLPVEGDQLNWRWATLETLLRGQRPGPRLVARVERGSEGAQVVLLRNAGSADAALAPVRVTWGSAHPFGDALSDYQAELAPAEARFEPGSAGERVISPGEQLAVGWLRFSGGDQEGVEAHVVDSRR